MATELYIDNESVHCIIYSDKSSKEPSLIYMRRLHEMFEEGAMKKNVW